jgi:uncharacterized protein (TIGR03382 family)
VGKKALIRWALSGIALSSVATAAYAVPIAVVSRPAQQANDSLDWSVLGAETTAIASGSTFNSVGGLGVTITNQTGFNLTRLTQRLVPPVLGSWGGDYLAGEALLFNSPGFPSNPFGSGPTTLTFSSGIFGLGFNFQPNIAGPFTGQIEAFDSSSSSLGIFSFSGSANFNEDGSNPYIGIRDTVASIFSITITGTGVDDRRNDFTLNQLAINTLAVDVPEIDPGSAAIPMFLSFGLLALRRRRRPGP